jgi:hypothetical protein
MGVLKRGASEWNDWRREHPDLRPDLQGADLRGADLREAELGDADLTGALLGGADLRGADLRGAELRGARLEDARLQNAHLESADLSRVAAIRHLSLSGAWFDRTRLRREQLDEAVAEEPQGEYDEARQVYLGLKQNFDGLGDYDAASWAYVRERRMERAMHAPWRIRRYFRHVRDIERDIRRARRAPGGLHYLRLGRSRLRLWSFYGAHTVTWLADWLVDAVCMFGESVSRVLLTLVLVFSLFALGYGLTGGIVRECAVVGCEPIPTYQLGDVALFSLGAMTTMEPLGLNPANELVQTAARLEALLAIALTGLLGFVLGNRIRRS